MFYYFDESYWNIQVRLPIQFTLRVQFYQQNINRVPLSFEERCIFVTLIFQIILQFLLLLVLIYNFLYCL